MSIEPKTRGEMAASIIKAHPEKTEQEIAALIDAQIKGATKPLVNVCKGMIEALEAGDRWTSVSRRIGAESLRKAIAESEGVK